MGVYAVLRGGLPSLCAEENFSFARHTTIGCGGYAEAAAYPRSAEEAAVLVRFLAREHIPYLVLGAGANVLPDDGVFRGAVIRLSRLNSVRAEGNSIFVGAGTTGGALLRFAREHGLGGLEPFAGIPMTAGGAVCMNAGVRACYFGERVKRVLAVEEGKLCILSQRECGFVEKSSVFSRERIVLRAELDVRPSLPSEIRAREKSYLAARSSLPKGRSAGCSFVNPPSVSAGALIEVCGLKGARRGDAVVSKEHANFILNEGTSSADVAALLDFVRETVYKKTGILLREEVQRLTFSDSEERTGGVSPRRRKI